MFSLTAFTSAGGQLKSAAVVVFTVLAPVTTATPGVPSPDRQPVYQTTNAGAPLSKPRSAGTGAAIAELRRLSGLTWEQLAGLLHVTRRALHFWATDKQMHPANEQRVHRLLAAMRRIDRGASTMNRTLLFGPDEDGVMPYDMLRDGEFEAAAERLEAGRAPHPPALPPQSTSEQEHRRPPKPADLLGAMQNSIHSPSGRVIRAKPIRRPRSK